MTPTNAHHVLNMILNDNRGQVLTEALILGIEASFSHYLNAVVTGEQREVEHGQD